MGYQLPTNPDSITIAGHTVLLGGTQNLAASDLTNGTSGSGSVVLSTLTATGGTTATAITNRFGHILNVIDDFGAKGDGTTDDTSALQAAIMAASGGHGKVYIPATANSYKITNTLSISSGTYICGDGLASNLKLAAGTNKNMFEIADTADNITITGISFDGNKANNPTGGCGILQLGTTGGTDITVTGCAIHDTANDCINLSGTRWKVTDNLLYNAGSTAFGNAGGVENNGGAPIIYAQIDRNIAFGCNGPGLALGNGNVSYSSISNNICYNNGQGSQAADSITAYGITNIGLIIANNQCLGGGNNGIHIGGSKLSIVGNLIDQPTNYGIVVAGKGIYQTGTVTTNGTATVVGVGTIWTSTGFRAGMDISIAGTDYTVLRITDNTHLVTSTTVPAGSGQSYVLGGFGLCKQVTVSGNTIQGGSSQAGIWFNSVEDGVIVGNTVNDTTGSQCIYLSNATRVSVVGNSGKHPSGDFIRTDPLIPYNVGTVSITGGSPNVVGSGTAFVANVQSGAIFKINTESVFYTVLSVTDDTHLTLTANKVGTVSAVAYSAGTYPSSEITVVGNTAESPGGSGINFAYSYYCTQVGNTIVSPTNYGVTESGASCFNAHGMSNFQNSGIAATNLVPGSFCGPIVDTGALTWPGLPTSAPTKGIWRNSGVLSIV